jgi:hypothetical protein
LSRCGKEKLEYLSSLGKSHLLVQLCKDFQVERRRRVGSGDLHHLVYGLRRDEEKDLSDEETMALYSGI